MTTPTMTMTSLQFDSDDEILAVAAAQRRELAAALSSDSDLDLAFHLQLQEAINASLSLSSATSSLTTSSSSQPNNIATSSSSEPDVATPAWLSSPLLAHAEYLDAVMLEQSDRHVALSQSRHVADDLLMRSHDRHVAEEINRMSEGEWEETGDEFHIPFCQVFKVGHSSRDEGSNGLDIDFRVYCKGLVSGEGVMGVGVAVCDLAGNVVFEMRKPVVGVGKGRLVAELKAVIEGLGVAGDLGLKGVIFCFDHYPVYQYLVGRWTPKQRKIFPLVNHVNQLRGKFEFSTPSLVIGNDMKFAFKLAREAIASHLNRPSESGSVKNINESCAICLDDKDVGQFFTVDSCSHRYCFSCMKQHVEVKLLHGMTARCPHEGCDSELKIENCKIFLTPKLIEMMTHRLKEASIPVSEKVYCPYPKCSYLMTKTDVLKYSGKSVISGFSARKCIKCNDFFCIYCKVPWHYNMSCDDYKMKNPYPPTEDAKLKMLANKNFWRQCVKCNHMIELDTGCYHMTCRCGYEFCYTCGAEWKNKKATCSCPLWDVDNILDQDYEFHEELHDDDDDDGY